MLAAADARIQLGPPAGQGGVHQQESCRDGTRFQRQIAKALEAAHQQHEQLFRTFARECLQVKDLKHAGGVPETLVILTYGVEAVDQLEGGDRGPVPGLVQHVLAVGKGLCSGHQRALGLFAAPAERVQPSPGR